MNTILKEKFTRQLSSITPKPRNIPSPLSYSSHNLITPVNSLPDPYRYITPYLKFTTFKQDFSYMLQIISPRNTIQIKDFSTQIRDILIFKPAKDVFKNIDSCLLVVLENQLIIYGFSISNLKVELLQTDMSVMIPEDILKVSVSKNGIITFCSSNDVYRFCYGHGIFYRTFAKKIKTFSRSFIEFFIGNRNEIVDVVVSNNLFAILKKDCVEVFKIIKNKFIFEKRYLIDNGIKISIFDEKCVLVIKKSGERVLLYGQQIILPLLGESNLYDGETIAESDGKTTIIIKSRLKDKNCLVIVINENDYAFEKKNNQENYKTLIINDKIECIKIFGNKIMLFSENKQHNFDILKMEDYLSFCQQDEMQRIFNLYGEPDFLINYLYLCCKDADLSRIEFMFLRSKNHDFIYKFIVKMLLEENIIQKENYLSDCFEFLYSENLFNDFFYSKKARLERLIQKFTKIYERIGKYRKNNLRNVLDDLKAVIDTLKFFKIITEKNLKNEYSFIELLCNMDYRRKVLNQLSNLMSFDKTNEMMKNTLKDYFPIEEVFYRRGLENAKKRRKENFYESVNDFKKGKITWKALKFTIKKDFTWEVLKLSEIVYLRIVKF
ncbi:hypothetical protein GVAV_002295 [Gurleya vavrai]